jgi:pyruvate/2-oxoglutarate/acetoin dehydrogenase E1 component
VPKGEHLVSFGDAAVVEEGEDVTVVAWGAMRCEAQRAANTADVELIDLRTIVPLDEETILDSVRETGRCVVVHEAPRTAGMAAEITARINDEALMSPDAPVERVTGYDVPFPLYAREEDYLPDPERIRNGIERAAGY